MAKYQNQNNRVISAAFKRFQEQYIAAMTEGYCAIGRNALDFLEREHYNDPHPRHITEENTIGYAVGYNGKVLASHGFNGQDGKRIGEAKEMAESIVTSHRSGWCLVVLSDMRVPPYKFSFEYSAYDATIEFTRQNFSLYFKQVTQ